MLLFSGTTPNVSARSYGDNVASTLRLQRVAQQQQQQQQQPNGITRASSRDHSAGRQHAQPANQRRPAAVRATLVPLQPLGQRQGQKSTDVHGGVQSAKAAATSASGVGPMRATMRTHSLQNICRLPVTLAGQPQHQAKSAGSRTAAPLSAVAGKSSASPFVTGVKRSASSQNVSFESSSTHGGVVGPDVPSAAGHGLLGSGSTPSRAPVKAAAVACNAELLAKFEREKRHMEARIAELTRRLEEETAERERITAAANAAAAAADGAATASADDVVPFIDDENADRLDALQSENRALRERLAAIELERQQTTSAAETERFTDAEKLRLLRWRPTANVGGSTGDIGGAGILLMDPTVAAAGRQQSRSFGDLRSAGDGSSSSGQISAAGVTATVGGQAATNHGLNRLSSLSVDAGLDHGGGAAVVAALRDRLALLQVRALNGFIGPSSGVLMRFRLLSPAAPMADLRVPDKCVYPVTSSCITLRLDRVGRTHSLVSH